MWEQFPFDEKVLTGFHCYDIDFTMQISTAYKNYVTYCVDILHKSPGSYDAKWLEASYSIMKAKWDKMTPISLGPMPSRKLLNKVDEELLWQALKMAYRSDSPYYYRIVNDYKKLPYNWKHIGRRLRLLLKYRKK